MSLPPWWQVATPHKDIRDGKLSEAIFAADLGDVIYGKAPLEYQDPTIFFQKTYITQGLKALLDNVISRLKGESGDPVIQLQTPFGGGKTHALLTLYHAIKNRKETEHLISDLPEARVAVFVGTHADALTGKTPWGEIASQLGQYEIVKEHDKKRIAPGKEKLRQLLEAAGPTLILMDEILEYIVKANRAEKVEKITTGQTLAFLQELSEVVASSKNCCLVITLPASILERYDDEAERSLQQLQKISGRVESVYTPVEGVEIYEVIRKRLFENIGDEKTRKMVAQSYFDLYQRLGADVPAETREIEYRERIERAYPFHPELIDVLYERWGSYSSFQRTRGVLRLLAEVVSDLYKRKVVSPLIQSSLVNLESQAIRREFVKYIGNEYDSVISADIAGKNAKAPKIDSEMGSEYEKYGIAKAIATTVFLYSFSGGASKETTLPRIRVSLLSEGIPATIVGDAIGKLEDELWYFHSEKKQYSFRSQPNLNRVIVDKEETISENKIHEELKKLIQKNAGRAMEVYLWPESPSDIPDNKNLKLAILSPEYSSESDKGKRLAGELFEKAGNGFRVYKNTLFILMMDDNKYTSLSKMLRRFLALSEIQNDASLLDMLPRQSQDDLRKKSGEAEKEMPFNILVAYRYLAMQEEGGMSRKDLGIPTIGSDRSISERVIQYLKDEEKLLTKLTPKYLLDKTFGKDEVEKPLKEIFELSLKTPGMALLESENVLLDAVAEGVKAGILGVKEDSKLYYGQSVTPQIDWIVLRGEFAKKIKEETAREGKEDKGPVPFDEKMKKEFIEKKRNGMVKRVSIRAAIPWDKLSPLISGVIRPLKDKGQPPEIIIEIKANSEEGYDRTTLDIKVKETLQQIDARIEEWKEE
ncbi:ATP-binding protein [Methanocella conradii]|uniref:ATP-binding protein n=1 Tax=Methanocella conradii TaxID=1175444 RepID=UPI0024B3A58B|nr:DUF499 domain-containing protein [Methanocella conradii]MDI6895774.1 DUF499 domain-containing protein [Methanocella conradii]